MTPPPSRPNRHRRRIVVTVALALVLVSSVAWWHWPRGDARFVGKWEWSTGVPPQLKGLISFHANGSAVAFNHDGRRLGSIPWEVEGERLLIGYRQTMVRDALMAIGDKAKLVLGVYLFNPKGVESFTILSSSEERIELDDPLSPAQQVLTRIPE